MSKKPDGTKSTGSGYRPSISHKGYKIPEWHREHRAILTFEKKRAAKRQVIAARREVLQEGAQTVRLAPVPVSNFSDWMAAAKARRERAERNRVAKPS